MSKILIIGGTGFAGSFIAKEAHGRKHEVTVLSRTPPEKAINGVHYVQGSALDEELRNQLIRASEVVVLSVSPRGDMAGKVQSLYLAVAAEAAKHEARLVIIGGFSSLRPAAGKPRFFESGNVPEEYLAEAQEIAGVFDALQADGPSDLSWIFISPAMSFGAYAQVPDYGEVRQGEDVALFDASGASKISGADFAIGIVDEIEQKKHQAENISLVH